jgi:hypothetical protein
MNSETLIMKWNGSDHKSVLHQTHLDDLLGIIATLAYIMAMPKQESKVTCYFWLSTLLEARAKIFRILAII